jgi:hypothetical protein
MPPVSHWPADATRHGRNSAVIPAAFYRLDGDQRVGTAACCVLTEFRLIGSSTVRKVMRLRSITTLCLFGVALVVALKYPLTAIGICICCLIAYLKPDPPVAGKPMVRCSDIVPFLISASPTPEMR